MNDFRKYPAVNAAGWTEWVSPLHGRGDRNFLMKCCDCGLVHDVQFRVKESRHVIFRMRRHADWWRERERDTNSNIQKKRSHD